jgi:hypothetical protein
VYGIVGWAGPPSAPRRAERMPGGAGAIGTWDARNDWKFMANDSFEGCNDRPRAGRRVVVV